MTPPPRPDDDPLSPPVPPGAGWEVVEPADPAPRRDPLLDDPLFAEITGEKPPELVVERDAPPKPAEPPPADEMPVARPVAAPARPRPTAPPPEPTDVPKPQWLAACAVIGCFGVALVAALGFVAYAAIALLSGIADQAGDAGLTSGRRPEPVGPTTLATPAKVINLKGVVDGVGRAAGGRFLLLRTGSTSEVHVFDPNEGSVTATFDVGSRQALFAGSASKLFVYRPSGTSAVLERYDLLTGKKEREAPRPAGVVQPDALVVGAGVDGPVYLVSVPANGVANVRVIDPDTLEPTPGGIHTITGWIGSGGPRVHARASDDGTLLGVTTGQGARVLRFPERGAPTLAPLGGLSQPTLAIPSPDGRLAFTPVGVADLEAGARRGPQSAYTFPTAHGSGLFLSLRRPAEGEPFAGPVRLRPTATPDNWVELPDIDVPAGMRPADRGDVPPDQRVHLWPAAGVALSIRTGSPQQLDVRKVDVADALAGLTQPHLVIGSEPRLWAARGREWQYAPTAWTNAGEVTVQKVEGPADMQVRDGRLVWTPPATAPGGVAVTVRVAAGRLTAEQRFRLAVVVETDDD